MLLRKACFLIFFLSLAQVGCKTFKRLNGVQAAIIKKTNHQDVNVGIHGSTSDGTSITVTLYNYKVDSFEVNELKRQAIGIDSIIIKVSPQWKNIKSRIIKFTSSIDPEGDDNIISFKFPEQNSK